MFPYKSFSERHYIVLYSFLVVSVIGIFYIPSLERKRKQNNYAYNKEFCEYIIKDRAAENLIFDLISIYYNTPTFDVMDMHPNSFRITEFSEEQERFKYEFNTVYCAGFMHKLIFGAKYYEDNHDIFIDSCRRTYTNYISKEELGKLLKYYFSMEERHIDIVWEQLCRGNKADPDERETIFCPKTIPTTKLGLIKVYEINPENRDRALARMARYKAELGVNPDPEGYVPSWLIR
jgi:hypothetical protein